MPRRQLDPVLAMSDRERGELLAILCMLQRRDEHDELDEDECHARRSPRLAAWATEQITAIQRAVERERETLDEIERMLGDTGGAESA